MPNIIAGRLDDLPSEIRHDLGRYRYAMFVQRLGWALPDAMDGNACEWDQFDTGTTVHVVALSSSQRVCGCARLLPTTGDYLLKEVFGELTGPNPPPASSAVWELSRFAGSGPGRTATGGAPGMLLFPYALAVAASYGATQVIGVVSRSIERLYRSSGIDLQRIHPDGAAGSASFIACAIALSSRTFSDLGCHPGELMRSIVWHGSQPVPYRGVQGNDPTGATGSRNVRID